jgi:hypothetical protein
MASRNRSEETTTATATATAPATTGKGVKLGALGIDDGQGKTDKPEYIKPRDLEPIYPFTIFHAAKGKGRFGDRINFSVAYKLPEGTVEKKVLTLSVNDEKQQLMYHVNRNKAITNCRIVEIDLGQGYTYWKIIDADSPIPEGAILDGAHAPTLTDDDIPF